MISISITFFCFFTAGPVIAHGSQQMGSYFIKVVKKEGVIQRDLFQGGELFEDALGDS
ncbi:MAG: hypothetical protein GY696_38055 [Gammaproteobacteria bacterium]|nr:hypothetical protein [Gammaproteobacteria bacterium]